MEQTIPTTCPTCSSPMKHIPAGVSRKTGKPYNQFWSCSNRCGYTWREGKDKQPASQSSGANEKTLEGLRAIYKEITELRKEFQDFIKIFIEKPKE